MNPQAMCQRREIVRQLKCHTQVNISSVFRSCPPFWAYCRPLGDGAGSSHDDHCHILTPAQC